MDFGYPAVLIVPFGLGLLGFVEPCTIGGHLIFVRTLAERLPLARLAATLTFTLVRTLAMGSFGALVVVLGQHLIMAQAALWLVFGSMYVLIGLVYLLGQARLVKVRIDVVPTSWKLTTNPVILGAAFGFNIPACAAPILIGLIGLAASTGAVLLGFATMAVFGLALSLPLALFVASPRASVLVDRLATKRQTMRWVLGTLFIALGLWSIWFGLFVDPADWASI